MSFEIFETYKDKQLLGIGDKIGFECEFNNFNGNVVAIILKTPVLNTTIAQEILTWINLFYENQRDPWNTYKKELVVLYNPYPNGYYKLYNVKIDSVDFGALDYESPEVNIKMFLSCEKIEYCGENKWNLPENK